MYTVYYQSSAAVEYINREGWQFITALPGTLLQK